MHEGEILRRGKARRHKMWYDKVHDGEKGKNMFNVYRMWTGKTHVSFYANNLNNAVALSPWRFNLGGNVITAANGKKFDTRTRAPKVAQSLWSLCGLRFEVPAIIELDGNRNKCYFSIK